MSEERKDNQDGKPRHYIGLLLGVPLLLFGMWMAGNLVIGLNSSRHPFPPDLKMLVLPGIASLAAGSYLIYRAR